VEQSGVASQQYTLVEAAHVRKPFYKQATLACGRAMVAERHTDGRASRGSSAATQGGRHCHSRRPPIPAKVASFHTVDIDQLNFKRWNVESEVWNAECGM
jgi:hypothetical protein